jgi:hypothetical protein
MMSQVPLRPYVLIGGALGYNFLRRTARAQPELAPFITPLLIAYVGFVVLSWLADPLLNLVLMARPEGRRLLTPDEKRGAVLVAACLSVAALLGGMAALSQWKNVGLSAFGVAFSSFAVAAAYQRTGRKRIQIQVLAGLALCASLAATVHGVGLLIAIVCIALATWMSHFGQDHPRLTGADLS